MPPLGPVQLFLIGDKALYDAGQELIKLLQPSAIVNKMVRGRGKANPKWIIAEIIRSAWAGIGVGNKPYAPYSERYKAILAAAGKTNKPWLLGILARTHMLDPAHFSAVRSGATSLDIVWSASDPAMAARAMAHTKGDPSSNLPQREWMHAENTPNQEAVLDAAELAISGLVEQYHLEIPIET